MNAAVASLLLVVALAPSLALEPRPDLVGKMFTAEVVGVVDGDTIDILEDGTRRTIRVRLDGIDTPESGEPFSQRARNFTRVMLFAQAVSVEGRDVDRYGRLVARVRVGGRDTSVELVREGLACHYRRFSQDPVLEQAERSARAVGAGFWAAGAAKPACVTREGTPPGTTAQPVLSTGQVIGNVRSRVYHAPTCRNAHCKNCTRVFKDRAEATRQGYRPAGDCLARR